MKFSFVNGIRQEPAPRLKGVCCHCGSATQAKCGSRKVWHWAHITLQHCDSWWESETEWHRLWKSYFPNQNQEIVHFDDATGEKHIADIKTNNAMVIEIQNSPMSESEMLSRENFYGKMMWIVNGEKFKNNFTILGKLPDPKSEIAQQVRFPVGIRHEGNQPKNAHERSITFGRFHLRNENPDYEKMLKSELSPPYYLMIKMPCPEEDHRVRKDIEVSYVGHHVFMWKNPRSVWFESTKPVFIDFGGDELWRLMYYDTTGLKCVKKVSKTSLIEKNGGCYVSSSNSQVT